ncbi:potassium-transporting ATPase subunit F [Curtobacterium luteum]|uniref:Potassium-transporting ATPase subunit F n=1 Tax=Curtobacterium luteum TaxID=33881 RepID=A0A8H9G8M6_9MICO|nr:potassium-transporting ATPase subunit F [Curtobacterium luteum]
MHVEAPPAAVLPHLADLTRWRSWSPWEGADPDLHREYTGDPGSVGATYAWSGNRKAGAGTMRVTEVDPSGVGIALDFTKPFRSSNVIRFDLTPSGTGTGPGTDVVWRMESPRTFMTRIFPLEKLVGPDFEKGLRQLKATVERG